MPDINLDPVSTAAKSAAKAIAETPSFKRTIDNIFYNLNRERNLKAEMNRIEDDVHLQRYRENLISGYNNIPTEDRLPPSRSITGQALRESQDYVEDEETIKFFENLILSSVDKKYAKQTHPAFINIVKQLSSLDAQNLKLFKDKDLLPIVDYAYDIGSGFVTFYSDVFLENPDEQDIDLQCVSIRNLVRLGLLELPEKQFSKLQDDTLYEKYKQTPLFISELSKFVNEELGDSVCAVITIDSYIALTALGKSFLKVCTR